MQQCVAALLYDGKVRTAVHKLKFRGRKSVAAALGRLVAFQVRAHLGTEFDLITFVPTNKHNRFKRGYDHAQLIAKHVGSYLNLPVQPVLRKIRRTKAMFGLDHFERMKNIEGAFATVRRADIRGKRILIIDDVLTTGSTLSECAATMLNEGACEVCAAVATVAQKSP